MVRIARPRDAPGDRGARNGEIFESGLDKGDDFIETRLRLHEVGMLFVKIEQQALIARQPKKIVLLARSFERMSIGAARVGDFLFREVRLVVWAIPPGEFAEVDVVGVALEHAANDLVHSDPMPRLGGADEIVVADVQLFPEGVMISDNAVGEFDRQNALLGRRPLDPLPVFVGAGEKPDVVAHPPAVTGDDVRDDVLVHVPDVRDIVDVVNRGGDVELLRHRGAGL